MEFLRKRSEEKQEEKRRMAEQAPWKQEGEATAKLLMTEDNYRGQETAPLFSSEALSDASLGTPSSASGAEKNQAKPKSGYVPLYEMESES